MTPNSKLRLRGNLAKFQKNRCYYCHGVMTKKRTKAQQTLDHFWPKCLGGKNDHENFVLACQECNNKKGHQTPFTFPAHPIFKQDYLARLNALLKNPEILTETYAR